MPLLPAAYGPPWFLRSGHLQTILPNLLRRVEAVDYQRRRIDTPDGDFLDMDWARVGSRRLGIVCHGLEGNSSRSYVLGMVRALNQAGWDALAWNYRGCGGQINRTLGFYHSGATHDLHTVVEHALGDGAYERAAVIGFSLGGNLLMKYFGERGPGLHPALRRGVAFSAPCDLASSARRSEELQNRLYMKRFMKMLRVKVRAKMALMPGALDDEGYERLVSFRDFDDRYTAPMHGFADAEDYWARSSSLPLLRAITVPTLLVNALDDPLLGPECYPYEEARGNPHLFLMTPRHGGHVGFMSLNSGGRYWSEAVAVSFLDNPPLERL